MGSDYAVSIIKTRSGQTVSGVLDRQTDRSVTLKTITNTVTLQRSEIGSITELSQSMMPPGLLDTLNERETIELLKYLESL